MQYRNKQTGTIYNIKNEGLLPFYEGSPLFEKIEKKPVTNDKKPKTTKTATKTTKTKKKTTKTKQ